MLGYLVPALTIVTPEPVTLALPVTVRPPPSMMYRPGFSVRPALPERDGTVNPVVQGQRLLPLKLIEP